mmetsp:Transcript_122465/g.305802  ORF Transcript_122465/g.305802 Transcript_122465/m.305802 type:complete len:251 (-) Transcript_122465:866-1618(-)
MCSGMSLMLAASKLSSGSNSKSKSLRNISSSFRKLLSDRPEVCDSSSCTLPSTMSARSLAKRWGRSSRLDGKARWKYLKAIHTWDHWMILHSSDLRSWYLNTVATYTTSFARSINILNTSGTATFNLDRAHNILQVCWSSRTGTRCLMNIASLWRDPLYCGSWKATCFASAQASMLAVCPAHTTSSVRTSIFFATAPTSPEWCTDLLLNAHITLEMNARSSSSWSMRCAVVSPRHRKQTAKSSLVWVLAR